MIETERSAARGEAKHGTKFVAGSLFEQRAHFIRCELRDCFRRF